MTTLVVRADGGVQPLNTPGGQLVGILPHAHFATTVSRLNPGDAFLLYTDGLTEARNPDGSILGDDHLLHLAADLTRADTDAIITTLAALLSDLGDGLTDDTALLSLHHHRPSPRHHRHPCDLNGYETNHQDSAKITAQHLELDLKCATRSSKGCPQR